MNAVWCAAKRLGFETVFDTKSRAKLKRAGHMAIMRSICNHIALSGIGSERGAANGLLDIINKGRTESNRFKTE
jgi:hypothetical protein